MCPQIRHQNENEAPPSPHPAPLRREADAMSGTRTGASGSGSYRLAGSLAGMRQPGPARLGAAARRSRSDRSIVVLGNDVTGRQMNNASERGRLPAHARPRLPARQCHARLASPSISSRARTTHAHFLSVAPCPPPGSASASQRSPVFWNPHLRREEGIRRRDTGLNAHQLVRS